MRLLSIINDLFNEIISSNDILAICSTMIILLERKNMVFFPFYLPAWFIIRDEEISAEEIDRCYIIFEEREKKIHSVVLEEFFLLSERRTFSSH